MISSVATLDIIAQRLQAGGTPEHISEALLEIDKALQCFDKEDGSSSCQTVFKEECVFDGQQVKSISGTTGQTYR